jgi:prepilin-type N-terminal cleavage/methylation domain-containing protein
MRRGGRRGFTLVELLVVIAVLALLAAFLLPIYSSARERGRQTVCLANLRQIGQALSMYRQDYGSYPGFWAGVPEALAPYVKNQRLLFCPSSKQPQGIKLSSSYAFLIDGDRLRFPHGNELQPRSVIVYCRDHAKKEPLDKRYEGMFPVLRHDGAIGIIPAGKVRVSSRAMPNRAPWFGGGVEVLAFPP